MFTFNNKLREVMIIGLSRLPGARLPGTMISRSRIA